MNIRWTAYALRRLQDRPEVTKHQAELAIQDPEQRFPDPGHPRPWIARKLLAPIGGSGLLRVIYEPGGEDAAAVVTF